MRNKRRWLKLAALFILLCVAVAYVVGELFFNLNSNLVFAAVRHAEKTPLKIRLKRGIWKAPTDLTPADLAAAMTERHAEPGLRWTTLSVQRDAGWTASLAQKLYGAEVHIIAITPARFGFQTTFQPKFALTTAQERLDADNFWFTLTANFRYPNGKPMGWVYHESIKVNNAFGEWSGCFFVKDGKPYLGPKSLLDDFPGPIQEGSQVYPAVMKNHTIFPYVELKPNELFDGSKITYRALGGMRRDGTIVFVLSGDGGVMNVAEVSEIARKVDVQHATLLDGGRALQYSIRTTDGPWHFAAFNTTLNINHPWFERQRSPVFIGIRRQAPQILTNTKPGA